MKELEMLLDNYWIIKDDDKELFYRVKDSILQFKAFLNEKLGYRILMNQHLIKLEKIPGSAESFMGIVEFNDPTEYVLLCLLLMFLEDKSREEQFVLSEITEFIEGNYIGTEKIDWTLYKYRKHFIKVLRFAQNMGMIKVDDGDEQMFAHHSDTEVLYESTGFSRYFVRHFTSDIMGFSDYQEMENPEWGEVKMDRGLIRRQRVYRKLLMEPAVYNRGGEDADYDYIKKQRGLIENDIQKYLDYNLHVHKNAAMVIVPSDKNLKDTFPDAKAISDITLLLNGCIRKGIEEGKWVVNQKGSVFISRPAFETMVVELKELAGRGWSKEYREMTVSSLTNSLLDYMESFKMLKLMLDGREIEILSLTGKLIGEYPKDFGQLEEKQDAK